MLTRIEVDTDRIRSNAEAIRARLKPGCELMAVVKGGGYGLGAGRVAAATGARWIGVGTLEEAFEVDKACSDARIVLLLPVDEPVPSHIMPSVFDERTAQHFAGRRVFVKVDTGLHRMGFAPGQVPDDVDAECLYSTLAEVDGFDLEQLARLRAAAARFGRPVKLSLASTHGLQNPELQLDIVRPGLALVESAVRFITRVVAVRDVKAGEGVGYSHLHRLERESRVATLPVGWEQGVPRALSNRGEVAMNGRRVRILGRISMNHTIIEGEGLRVGDEIELLGPTVTPDDWATWAGTSPYEILVRLGPRVPRVSLSAPLF